MFSILVAAQRFPLSELEIERAIEVLRSDRLLGADILALQKMEEAGGERIARELGHDYAFYPADIHPTSGRYLGDSGTVERRQALGLPATHRPDASRRLRGFGARPGAGNVSRESRVRAPSRQFQRRIPPVADSPARRPQT
jgi:hypothetical protein